MRNKKIQFILSEADVKPVYSVGWAPPLAFLSIATFSGLEMELLDSQIISQSEIEEKIDCDILAGSINFSNYGNFLRIAQKYKEKSPKGRVIVGGPHSLLAKNILRNRPYIDAVIVGKGERAFLTYCQNEDLSQVPNLTYRKNNQIIFNRTEDTNLKDLPIPDRNLVNLESYFNNFNGEFKRPTTMYSQVGCFWGRCVFCQVKPPVESKTPEQFWQEIKYLQDSYDIDYIWDVSDSPDKKRILELQKNKLSNIDVRLRFYARTSEIDEEIVKALRILNCYEVFLGIETGDPFLLQRMDKNSSLEQHLKAVEILARNEIKPRISFVFGLPRENEKTLENTYNFAKQLISAGADSIACSILMPVPGSKSFKMMLQKHEKKYSYEDLFDTQELQIDWVKSFCEVDYSSLLGTIKNVENLKSKKFGGLFK